mmetsp:Transcript_48924/g.104450  ORF Transcript_48924/g.104450 Transcript_48924/m.104450 type:complete len:212 (+) Transcript_48924:516-1151(+)
MGSDGQGGLHVACGASDVPEAPHPRLPHHPHLQAPAISLTRELPGRSNLRGVHRIHRGGAASPPAGHHSPRGAAGAADRGLEALHRRRVHLPRRRGLPAHGLAAHLARPRLLPYLLPVRLPLLQHASHEREPPRGQAPLRLSRRISATPPEDSHLRPALLPLPGFVHDAPAVGHPQALPEGGPLPPPRARWRGDQDVHVQGQLQRVQAAEA